MILGLEIGLSVVCGGVLGAIFYFTKKHLKQYQELKKQDTVLLQQLKQSIKTTMMEYDKVREMYNEQFNKLQTQINTIEEEYHSLAVKRENDKRIIEKDYDSFVAARAKDKEFYLKQIREDAAAKEQELIEERESLTAEVQRYKEKIISLNNSIALAEQEEKDKEFYKITISKEDITDIQILKELAPKLKNSSILYKLIWKTYYQKPLTLLINRVVTGNKVSGIYKITNTINNKSYIGRSVDIAERWKQHVKGMLRADDNKITIPFYNEMFDVGPENLTFEVLHQAPPQELAALETYYINLYDTITYGYNDKDGNK